MLSYSVITHSLCGNSAEQQVLELHTHRQMLLENHSSSVPELGRKRSRWCSETRSLHRSRLSEPRNMKPRSPLADSWVRYWVVVAALFAVPQLYLFQSTWQLLAVDARAPVPVHSIWGSERSPHQHESSQALLGRLSNSNPSLCKARKHTLNELTNMVADNSVIVTATLPSVFMHVHSIESDEAVSRALVWNGIWQRKFST